MQGQTIISKDDLSDQKKTPKWSCNSKSDSSNFGEEGGL